MKDETATHPAEPSVQPDAGTPEWMAVVRVYGSIMYATKRWGGGADGQPTPLEPRHIEGWMEDCANHGITAVLWRANCAGCLTYPSRFTALAGEPPLPDSYQMGDGMVEQGWTRGDWDFLGEQCRRLNTLEVAVGAAHAHGLRLYLDFSTFDLVGVWCTGEQWPAGGERAFDEDLWLWSKDRQKRLAGVPCYADPRVRELRVAEIAEALEHGIDGVVLGFFSHCDSSSGERPCWYGYNPVVTEEYMRRYSQDPLSDGVDAHRFFALHGEYFTQFVREAGEVVHASGKKLLCTARTDGVHGWNGVASAGGMGGAMGAHDLRHGASPLPFAAGLYLEWEKWAREDLVDGLVAWAPFDGGITAAQRMRSEAQKPVYLLRKYSGWKGEFRPPQSLEGFRREVRAIREGALDGYVLHLLFIVNHEWMSPDWRDLIC